MELWRHAQRIIDAPLDVIFFKKEDDKLRYLGIFLIIASLLIALMMN